LRSKSNIKEEPYLAIVLLAILSVPLLVGCSQKKGPSAISSERMQAEPVGQVRNSVAPRGVLDLTSRKARAREAVERARKAARSKAKESSQLRVKNSARMKEDIEVAKQAEGAPAGQADRLGNKQLGTPGLGAGGNEKIDPRSSPALQSAERLIKIFEATEKALPESS